MKRILVLGGGLIGSRHIDTVRTHPNCELVGLVDPDSAIQSDVRRFTDMSEVKTHVDGVIIATPTNMHAEHGISAARRGWHMLIEKPVAGTLLDAKTLATEISLAGVQSLVGHHRRYHRHVQQLKGLLASGKIGQVINVSLMWCMRKPDGYFAGNWRTAGGSPVLINLVHDIDILRFVVGEISRTLSVRGASVRGADRIESGAVALAFENGATGTISFADTAASPWGFEAGTGENPNIGTTAQDMMWIAGTNGAVSFPSMTLWSGTDWGTAALRVSCEAEASKQPPLSAQLDHFIDVMDGHAPLIDVAEATRTLAIAEQIERQLQIAPDGASLNTALQPMANKSIERTLS